MLDAEWWRWLGARAEYCRSELERRATMTKSGGKLTQQEHYQHDYIVLSVGVGSYM